MVFLAFYFLPYSEVLYVLFCAYSYPHYCRHTMPYGMDPASALPDLHGPEGPHLLEITGTTYSVNMRDPDERSCAQSVDQLCS